MKHHHDVDAALGRPGGILSRFRRKRERGFALMEGILYLSLLASVVVFTTGTLREEGMRQEESLIADALKMLQDGSGDFVLDNYDQLRQELFDVSASGGDALMSLDMMRLADEGSVPTVFLRDGGTIRNTFGQQYALILRAVDRQDSGAPQATLTRSQLDPSSTGSIASQWVDNDPSNGEMEIESLLVSHSGQPIPLNRSGRVLAKTGLQIIGLVVEGDVTRGAYGNFELSIAPYQALAEYPTPGHFANLVSLSGFGVLGVSGDRGLVDMDRALLRCADISPASDPNAYNACLDNTDNEFMSQLVFREYDDDSGSKVYPGIRGLTNLTCDGTDPAGTIAPGTLLVDCGTTTFDGDLAVTASLTVDDGSGGTTTLSSTGMALDGVDVLGTTTVGAGSESRLSVDRALVGGMDVGQYLIDPEIVLAQGEVEIPTCGTDENGVALQPAIYTSPAGFADARGRPLVGIRAFAESASATSWRVRMISFVEEDYCQARNGSGQIVPLDPTGPTYSNGAPNHPNCSAFNPDGTVATDRSDGKVDIYEVVSGFGKVMAQTRCVAP
ncbi:hypothetical protein [Palleronia sp.]|uniref:hypothetical protein n=1 Tax=Palleronia sp. TaxID=1940284 RepID=UPI0035C7E0AF